MSEDFHGVQDYAKCCHDSECTCDHGKLVSWVSSPATSARRE
jgi:hypothetical protein